MTATSIRTNWKVNWLVQIHHSALSCFQNFEEVGEEAVRDEVGRKACHSGCACSFKKSTNDVNFTTIRHGLLFDILRPWPTDLHFGGDWAVYTLDW